MGVAERQASSFTVLKAVYEAANGRPSAQVDVSQAVAPLNMTDQEVAEALEYLIDEGLAEHKYYNDQRISLTQYGLKQIESALAEPQHPTKHFPAVINITHVQTMIHSQVQQGTDRSSQHQVNMPVDAASLIAFVRLVRSRLHELELPPEVTAEVQGDLTTLEAQANSPRPKPAIVRETLKSLRTILEGAAGSGVAAYLLPKLVAMLGG
jgi:hypothetical protein